MNILLRTRANNNLILTLPEGQTVPKTAVFGTLTIFAQSPGSKSSSEGCLG